MKAAKLIRSVMAPPRAAPLKESRAKAIIQSLQEGAGKKGCVMVYLSPEEAAPILDFVNKIRDEDLYVEDEGFGRELSPHVTVLYGLIGEGDDPDAIDKALPRIGLCEFTLENISTFSNPDKPYDVLKIDVQSDALHELNAALRELPYENDYPDYHPHLTLAYLKKGVAEKYTGTNPFEGQSFSFDRVTHSTGDDRVKSELLLTESHWPEERMPQLAPEGDLATDEEYEFSDLPPALQLAAQKLPDSCGLFWHPEERCAHCQIQTINDFDAAGDFVDLIDGVKDIQISFDIPATPGFMPVRRALDFLPGQNLS